MASKSTKTAASLCHHDLGWWLTKYDGVDLMTPSPLTGIRVRPEVVEVELAEGRLGLRPEATAILWDSDPARPKIRDCWGFVIDNKFQPTASEADARHALLFTQFDRVLARVIAGQICDEHGDPLDPA